MTKKLFSRQQAEKRRQQVRDKQRKLLNRDIEPQGNSTCDIVRMNHDGRGVALRKGKTRFVDGALTGEQVKVKMLAQHANFDELKMTEVLKASDDRVEPKCEYTAECGGCSLQHLKHAKQLEHKERVLREQLAHFAKASPKKWLEAMQSEAYGYRSKARLSTYYDAATNKISIGFRAKGGKQIVDIKRCAVLDVRVGDKIDALHSLVLSMSVPHALTHFEIAAGDDHIALLIRHVEPLSEEDKSKLVGFVRTHQFDLYLQPGGAETVHKVWPENSEPRLSYRLPYALDKEQNTQGQDPTALCLSFHPKDFTQVNLGMNRKMVLKVLEYLDVQKEERVLDLFSGLGNFTLPVAVYAKEVVGVEGSEKMVQRGMDNASQNSLSNVSFYTADLFSDISGLPWARQQFDKILIDPPRAGALEIVNFLSCFGAKRIVYISCNPATLARDTAVLIAKGYILSKAGVLDMFPHTSHVESIAVFDRKA